MTRTVLVTGATGRRGGATVDALRSGEFGDFEVRVTTRDADSDRARALTERGVEVVEADLLAPDSLETAMTGVDAAFCVTTFRQVGAEAEREQGANVVAAAEAVSLPHLVFSSVGNADADTGLAHFETKADTERRLRESDLTWTVLRPVFFMQDLADNAEEITEGRLSMALDEGVSLAMVDVRDVGRGAAAALADSESFAGETLTLVGESLTLEETCAILAEYVDHDVDPIHIGVGSLRAAAGDEMADTFDFFNRVGYDVDVDVGAVEARLGFDFHTLAECLAETDLLSEA